MRGAAVCAALLPLFYGAVLAIVVPFDNAELSLDRRHNTCPRVVGKYGWCDDITKCCQPGYGCNTCGEGNVGQSCVKREKDGCKTDSDCYWSQKCINNGKEPSFCAQLWVDDLPKPEDKDKKKKKKKKKPTPAHKMNPSSLAPSSMLGPTLFPSLAPSSMIMAPPMPTPKKDAQAGTPHAMPPKQAQPKAKESPKQAGPVKQAPKSDAPKPTNSA